MKKSIKLSNDTYIDDTSIVHDHVLLKQFLNNIVESGSNDNGRWIKYIDGTMICYKSLALNAKFNNASGSLYRTDSLELGNFAQPFIATPFINITKGISGYGCWLVGCDNASATSAGAASFIKTTQETSNVAIRVNVLAIGRWK